MYDVIVRPLDSIVLGFIFYIPEPGIPYAVTHALKVECHTSHIAIRRTLLHAGTYLELQKLDTSRYTYTAPAALN